MNYTTTDDLKTPAFGNVPQELAERNQWVLWKSETRKGELAKVPKTIDRYSASPTDPEQWTTFESVVTVFDESKDSGIGFVFSETDDLLGVDLDGCRNPETGTLAPWAESIVSDFATYTEVSPSGTGVKLWCRSGTQLPTGKNKKLDEEKINPKEPGVEVYTRTRYFAVTGAVLDGHSVVSDCTTQVDNLLRQYWGNDPDPQEPRRDWRSDDAVVERARKYVVKIPGAVSGNGGHSTTFSVACRLVQGFELTKPQALDVLAEWNATCQPPWTEAELLHKIDGACKQSGETGYLRNSNPERYDAITKDLNPAVKLAGVPMLPAVPPSVDTSGGKPDANGASVDKCPREKIKTDTFEPFPLDCLPEVLRRFVAESSQSIGCDTTFSVLPALAVCAAAIGTSRSLMVKRGWFVPSLIWMVIVGESGSQKSPAFKLAVKPLKNRQKDHAADHAVDMGQFLDNIASHKRENKRWEKTGEGERPEAPTQPVMTRSFVQDSTIEALAPILMGNPRGVLLARDELSGWFGSFNQYSNGSGSADVQKWLEIYGNESITIDRKTGDQRFIFVPHPSVTICGGIQPAILSQCLTDENKSNGLQSRLLMAHPPRRPKRYRDDEVSESTLDAYHSLIDDLSCLKPETDASGDDRPTTLRLTDDARQLFKDFVNRNGEEQNGMSGALASQWSKLEEIPARLAITLHCVRQVTDGVDDAFMVDAATMQAAITLGEWFKTECLRINRLLAEPEETREANRLVDWIRSKGGKITARDLYRYRRDIPTSEDAETKLIHLVSINAGTWRDIHNSREFILTGEVSTVAP